MKVHEYMAQGSLSFEDVLGVLPTVKSKNAVLTQAQIESLNARFSLGIIGETKGGVAVSDLSAASPRPSEESSYVVPTVPTNGNGGRVLRVGGYISKGGRIYMRGDVIDDAEYEVLSDVAKTLFV